MKKVFHLNGQKFGFGCMRLPMIGEDVDIPQFTKMVDAFIAKGFIYFDTAHGYLNGKSETAIREALTSRYPRSAYTLTDKLTSSYFQTEEDIVPFFNSQLEACGVDYFDFYLMHAQNKNNYKHFSACHAYETAAKLKAEGKIKYFGLSFHDTADVLDMILTEHPEVDLVQIQLNYLDYEDINIQSRLCYEVAVKHNKPLVIMEPIKGGNLINLPEDALEPIKEIGLTPQNLALRFAASLDQVFMVLSGMSTYEQMEDNLSFMKDFEPLSKKEIEASQKVANILRSKHLINCTSCRYCVEGCPQHIVIPNLFSMLNSRRVFHNNNAGIYYRNSTANGGKASSCIKCGKCERTCPQHLPIRDLLVEVAKEFENK